VILDFYVYNPESDGNPFRYSYTGPQEIKGDGDLKRMAPGHYQASLPFTITGDFRVDVKEERRGRTISYPVLGYTLPSEIASEAPTDDVNVALLERIARATGGSINPSFDSEAPAHTNPPTAQPLRAYLILSAALVFLAEIFFRRFVLHPVEYR
jgi:hypothetical protein